MKKRDSPQGRRHGWIVDKSENGGELRQKLKIHVQAEKDNIAGVAQLLRLRSHINRVGVATLQDEIFHDLEIGT
jgi:hypothetical protein